MQKIGLLVPYSRNLKKILMVMKLLTLLLIVSLATASAKTSYSQQTKFTLNLEHVTVKELFDKIEGSSEFIFVYYDNIIDLNQEVTVTANNETVEEILERVFKVSDNTFKIFDRQIVISKKERADEEFGNLPNSPVQKKELTGTINDSKGFPLPGVTIVVKGTTLGAITDAEGKFYLSIPGDAKSLAISFIGMKSQEIVIGNKSNFNIVLEDQTVGLEEVVAVGYGQVRKSDVTGSVVAIKPDAFNKGRQLNAQDALVGKIPGVIVVPGSGAPGSTGDIRIRMGASLAASNDPLIVIDDVPVTSTSINMVNPDDIATYTVLKDASATAIYGSRASNGVIIITTKKGDASSGKAQKPTINYNNNFTSNNIIKYSDVLSTDEFKAAVAAHSSNPSAVLGTASTNWQKEIYRSGFGQEHNLSVVGAAKHLPYRVSLGYTDQDGIIKTNNYQRTTVGLNVSPMFLKDHLLFNINIKGSIENEKPVSTGVIGSANGFDPTRPVYQTYPGNVGLGYFTWMNGGVPISLAAVNPVSSLELGDRLNKTNRSIGNMAITYKVHGFEDVKLHVNLGYDISKKNNSEMVPDLAPSMYTGNLKNGTGMNYTSESNNTNTMLDLFADYNKTFAQDHSVSFMGGYSWQHFWYKSSNETMDLKGNQIVLPVAPDLGELYLISLYGRLNYAYKGKYMVTSTLRGDASSRFSPETRWGYFPSVALGWHLSKEDFMKHLSVISDLKLRLSYGQTGQQSIGSYYQYLSTYAASDLAARYEFGSKWYTTYRPNGYDPEIKWETTSTYNAGLDFGLFKSRITGSIDIYKRNTSDLLNQIFVPAGSNFTNVISTNIGSMTSKGAELALNFIPVQTKDWNWTIGGNFTYNSSTITKLNIIETGNNYILTGNAGGSTGRYLQVHMVGQTPYTFFLLKQAYDSNGKPLDGKYIAKDGSVVTSEENSNKYIDGKSSQAPYFYGFSSKVSFRNWDLGMNGHGSFGNYLFNYVAAQGSYASLYDSQGSSSNLLHSTLTSGFTQQRLFTDYFLEKGDFLKLDNVTLGYSLHKLIKGKSSLRFSFTVQNVAIITKYSGIDPEIFNGIDNNVYPRPRNFMFGLNLNID